MKKMRCCSVTTVALLLLMFITNVLTGKTKFYLLFFFSGVLSWVDLVRPRKKKYCLNKVFYRICELESLGLSHTKRRFG